MPYSRNADVLKRSVPGDRAISSAIMTHSRRHCDQAFLARCPAIERALERPAAHDENSVAHTQYFRQLRGDEKNRQSLMREAVDDIVHFGFGDHVDAARGLIENEHFR